MNKASSASCARLVGGFAQGCKMTLLGMSLFGPPAGAQEGHLLVHVLGQRLQWLELVGGGLGPALS